MATVYEYYKTDFWHAVALEASLGAVRTDGQKVSFEKSFMLDLNGNARFLALHLPHPTTDLIISIFDQLPSFLTSADRVNIGNRVRAGTDMKIHFQDKFVKMTYRGPGDDETFDIEDFPFTGRIFIYCDRQISSSEWGKVREAAQQRNLKVLYRGPEYAAKRNGLEKPKAFISHDFRDKEAIARPIAIRLRDMMCPVWYDEFSLQVGDSLREGIERGLKSCHMCIFILTPNFLSKGGWPKREYDAIFTRELVEERQLILPVRAGVSQKEVFDYSPVLAGRLAIDWALGEEEVCRRLFAKLVV